MSGQTHPLENDQMIEKIDSPPVSGQEASPPPPVQAGSVQGTYVLPQAPPPAPPPPKINKGVPGMTGFGFTSALLSLFLLPLYKDAFEAYLLYEGAKEVLLHYYYYATIALGSGGILLALFGLILTPVGIYLSKRREGNGRALGVSGLLIALVALILFAAVTVTHVTLYSWLYPK